MKIEIIKCRNRFFWYQENIIEKELLIKRISELQLEHKLNKRRFMKTRIMKQIRNKNKKLKLLNIYEAKHLDNGVVIKNKGFIYNGDYLILN